MELKLKAAAVAGLLAIAAGTSLAEGPRELKTRLSGYEEVPAVSSQATGQLRVRIDEAAGTMDYELTYAGLEADALQSHIHFGQPAVNGGISVFLCTNLGNGPAGTPACPLREGTVTGTLTAASVVGPNAQGIAPGQFDELLRALRADVAYANVHSTQWPGGEIRGQIGTGAGRHPLLHRH